MIRPARIADIDAIVRFDPAWNHARWRTEVERARVWVSLRHGQVAGALCRWALGGEWELHRLVVDPAQRRRGIASALLRSALEREPGAWLLEVASKNEPARALYECWGFAEVGRRAQYYRDGDDAILMRRPPAEG